MPNPKTPTLSDSKKLKIGKYAEANPEASKKEIQLKFGCTYNQVIYAIKAFQSGKLHRKPLAMKESRKAHAMMDKFSAEELILKQFHLAAASLNCDETMNTDERVAALDKLVNMQKKYKSMDLQSHMNRLDSDILLIIIRRFMPDASDDDALKIYKEALETWKLQ